MQKKINTVLSEEQLALLKDEPTVLVGPNSGLNEKHRAVLAYKKEGKKNKKESRKSDEQHIAVASSHK